MTRPAPWSALRRLAQLVGVARSYSAAGHTHEVPDATLRAVLGALGHACATDGEARRSLRAVRRVGWTRAVDPVAVVWRGGTDVGVRVTVSGPADSPITTTLTLEDGGTRTLPRPVWGGTAETVAGRRRRGTLQLPADLPLGYHRLRVDAGATSGSCTIIVAPDHAPPVDAARRWGWMLQAYAVRSEASWGQGEFRDLGALAEWAAADGADFLLLNPVHAPAPVLPQQPSPYSPTSRRFVNPCYLHVPDVPGFAELAAHGGWDRADLPAALAADSPRIDRDAVWRTKRRALWELYAHGPLRDATARARLAAYREAGGTALQRFATFSALAEEHGTAFASWPEALRDPRSPPVAAWAAEHDDVVGFHAWLQQQCGAQLAAAQARALSAGMAIGLIGDLAVGVAPDGADVWALPDAFARSMRVGAPPDAFNQQGQDWGQPPPLPEAMRTSGHQLLRQVLGATLAEGGGIRVDHILGFSRLFWIPADGGPADGTYVRYPADELFAVLALEAHRVGAVVIGEDLGTVDDRIRRLMRDHGIAGSAVLWFATDRRTPHGRMRADDYPRSALASVTTHDLPTATGWWDGTALRVRSELELLDRPVARERERLADDHATMTALLVEAGALDSAAPALDGDGPDAARTPAAVRERVLAMHRFLAGTGAALAAVALWDGVGDPRQPNVPGTVDQYPNWRLPLAVPGADGPRPLTVEGLREVAALDDLVAVMRAARG